MRPQAIDMAQTPTATATAPLGISTRTQLRLLGGITAALLAGTVAYMLWGYLIHRPEFLVHPATFRLDTPAWTSPELAEQIRTVEGLSRSYSIFERGLTKKIARIYESSPWVRKVHQIKREFPNKISMRLELRRPAAAIRKGQRYYLVDEDAVRLPRDYYLWPHPAIKPQPPMLLQDRLTELPNPGERWQDRGVRAGVLLGKYLAEHGMLGKLKITTIDATNVGRRRRGGDSCLVLLTEGHTKILWGCSPLCNQPRELTDQQKLASLVTVAEAEKYDFSKLEYIDVRWERPAARKRLVAKVE